MTVVNHGTHRRAEDGLLLPRMGHSPDDMHFVLFVDERL